LIHHRASWLAELPGGIGRGLRGLWPRAGLDRDPRTGRDRRGLAPLEGPLAPLLIEAGITELPVNSILSLLPVLQPVIEKQLTRRHVRIDAGTVRLGAPVPRPPKIIVAGGNYPLHVDEAAGRKNAPSPSEPLLIFKPSNTVIGPPSFLSGGDVVRMEISGLGVMETPIVDEVIESAS
jgi:hypothetical protein